MSGDVVDLAKAALVQALTSRPMTVAGAMQAHEDVAEAVSFLPELIEEVERLRARETKLRARIQDSRDSYARRVDEYIGYRIDYNGPAAARDALDAVLAVFDGEGGL